jgi:hypothetical protein
VSGYASLTRPTGLDWHLALGIKIYPVIFTITRKEH